MSGKFLNGKGLFDSNAIALQGFPRSGTTLLRCYLEAITGIVTGSDTQIEDSFNLAMMGMVGEDTVGSDDKRVWVTKTDYPMKQAAAKQFSANKLIIMVRNPLETIASNARCYAL